ncbi:hypothetical protein FHX57_000605 [Paraburkholderia tropica]|uniref:HNH endonuclease n=1 Tax=Paraburkholderia tropica TaxID=92647 RepID=UPI00160F712F|nr:HNH endonuclease signature motif containing protein [Paraburkholderia tropica]MBB2998292.1 hypothetical protein [Paraburkholderia tropica]
MMTTLERLRVEKAAADCGFERTPILMSDGGLELRSAQFPEAIIVHICERVFRVSASKDVLLDGADASEISVGHLDQLYAILQRASVIARTIPNRVADQFRLATKHLPQTTEAERLVVQRVGQGMYRNALMDYWQGHCCVTGLAVPTLLRASHIKPWAKCQNDDERLDVFNGFLLAPHVDALFDGGWISFSDQGNLIVSDSLPFAAKTQLGVSPEWTIHNLKPAHASYLKFHRAEEFRKC